MSPAGSPASDKSNKPAKVLVIDDDAIFRDLLRLHLSNHGYQVLVAEHAILGGHLVLSEAPDLIIVDVEMPYINGYEFVEALKGDLETREIPIVFLTVDENVAVHAKRLGAAAYLNKPVMLDALLDVVRRFTSPAQGIADPRPS
jgi:CheY-like chemotaxis protein